MQKVCILALRTLSKAFQRIQKLIRKKLLFLGAFALLFARSQIPQAPAENKKAKTEQTCSKDAQVFLRQGRQSHL